ncbi:MAG: type II toxin-antitoxin system HicB family antitoxin [Verrucomicrobiales bacterium]|jgi:predicted RNase H-like HicB family nuclease|nr:type II toxin-antitoxin system HicB family antitoxin [Verrucomicrobiales bacterium]
MIIRAITHPAEEGGFWAEVPALPGCMTQGETIEELRANLREAIELYLEAATPDVAGDQQCQILEFAV